MAKGKNQYVVPTKDGLGARGLGNKMLTGWRIGITVFFRHSLLG